MTTKSRPSSALKSIGGKKELQRQFRQYSLSVNYIDRDRRKLLRNYDNKWVAVYDSKLVAHGKTYNDVIKTIGKKGLPIGQVALKFISSRRRMTLY
ncbi:DUF5678 domain-containing protein [Chloroflexota bacterium]